MSSQKASIVAIVGRANVGKSSLFNAIIGQREAITADEPGTTRDSIMARASRAGKDFWLVDTAGMKPAEDDFELTIQEQITEATSAADMILVVVEADVPPTEEDRRVAKMALKSGKPVFLIINKLDRNRRANLDDWRRLGIQTIFATSVTQRAGIDDLLDYLSEQLPKARIKVDDRRIRVGILGRPNVGKSALFNALAKKQQAIVADRAGTTRDVNRTTLRYEGREIELADTAGIRRSGKIERGVEHFSVLRSIAAIEQSNVCLLLMDANELNVQLDQKIAGMIKDAGKGLILVVSKWDNLEEKDAYSRDALAPQIAANFEFVPWAPLIFTSSVTGQNITKLFELISEIAEVRQQRFSTPELNSWLGEVTRDHPPAGLKNRSPKLNYIVQEENDFPNFKVFGAHTRFLHWSYKRYMERKFRERWPLSGTPLKFWFIEKH